MTGFVREHLRPLVGSAGLHLLLLAVFAGAALKWTSSQPPVQLAIEGVVVDAKDLPRSLRSGKTPAVPRLRPAEPPPVEQSQADDRAAEEAARARADRARTEQEQARREAEADRKKAAAAEAQRRKAAESERQEKKDAEARAAAQAKAAAEEKAKADAKAAQEAKAKAAADAKAKAAREAELQRSLAAEEAEGAAIARSGVIDEYRALLVQTIERNWIRPPSARAGLSCTLYVTQATGGMVTDVRIGACNGDEAVRESIVNAVYRASPLPAPRDPRAFERRLEIVFRPTE